MKILITGVNGFLGRNLAQKFIDNGHSVFGTSLHTNNITNLTDRMVFHVCNMNEIDNLKPLINQFGPEIVIHCAWWGGNSFSYINNPSQFYSNVPQTVKLIEILPTSTLKQFVGIGTSAEYQINGDPIKETEIESSNSLYGTTKTMARLYTEQICHQNNIQHLWIRPFWTYGPYDVTTRLIPKTILACLKNDDIILSDCTHLIDYMFITDFIECLYGLITLNQTGVFNICSGNPIIIKDIVMHIKRLTHTSSKITFDPSINRKNFPPITYGDNTKLKNALGAVPNTGIIEGLERTIEFYKNR